RVDAAAELRQHRRVVAGTGADLEHLVAGADLECLGHARDDEGLAHRLAVTDRQRDILIGLIGEGGGHEELARDPLERAENARVGDAEAAQLHDEAQLLRRRGRVVSGHAKSFVSTASAGTLVKSRKTGVTDTAPSLTAARSVPESFGASSRMGPIQ